MKIAARLILSIVVGAIGLFAAANLYPAPLFAHSATHGAFTIRSDRPIDPAIGNVVDDAERRLRTSGLYRPDARFRVFICNDRWRLMLLTRSAQVGAVAETVFTRNIYVREVDIRRNRIVPPYGTLADADQRPLSYFLAHEATHVLQSRRYGRATAWRIPRWLIEGHADLVAKGGDFDVAANRALLDRDDPRLDYHRSGLYRRYHLMVAAMLRADWTVDRLFADPPTEADALLRVRDHRGDAA